MKRSLAISAAALIAALPFTIDIVGAHHYADVATVHQGLHRSDGVERVNVVRTSENFVRMEGVTQAEEKDFLSDLGGLAQDRFSMETVRYPNGSLAITLRKIK